MLAGSQIRRVLTGSVAGVAAAASSNVAMPAGINWAKTITGVTNAGNVYANSGGLSQGRWNGSNLVVVNQNTATDTVNWVVIEFN